MGRTTIRVRLLRLSVTLPNYEDVATFLQVEEKKGLFYFDASYRPCGLQQQFIGITEKKVIKRYQITNEVCYEKVLDQVGKNQTLVFVHFRKETAKTTRFLRDTVIEEEMITQFVKPDGAVRGGSWQREGQQPERYLAIRLRHSPRWNVKGGLWTRGRVVCGRICPGPGLHGDTGLGSQSSCPYCYHQGNADLQPRKESLGGALFSRPCLVAPVVRNMTPLERVSSSQTTRRCNTTSAC